MKRPASCGQHFRMGNSDSEKLSRRMISLHGPVFTDLGKKEPSSASFGNILILSSRPCGDCMSRKPRMRAATSSMCETSRARFMRRSLPSILIRRGTREPFGFSNSKAGPPARVTRSVISVISRTGSISAAMRRNSPSFSSLAMNSRKSRYAKTSSPMRSAAATLAALRQTQRDTLT